MKKKGNITRVTAEELKRMIERGETKSDWKRANSISYDEIERLADDEEGPLPPGWNDNIVLGLPSMKDDVHMRLDRDVLEWFKAQGKGYQTRINAVLRAFVDSGKRPSAKHSRTRKASSRANAV